MYIHSHGRSPFQTNPILETAYIAMPTQAAQTPNVRTRSTSPASRPYLTCSSNWVSPSKANQGESEAIDNWYHLRKLYFKLNPLHDKYIVAWVLDHHIFDVYVPKAGLWDTASQSSGSLKSLTRIDDFKLLTLDEWRDDLPERICNREFTLWMSWIISESNCMRVFKLTRSCCRPAKVPVSGSRSADSTSSFFPDVSI